MAAPPDESDPLATARNDALRLLSFRARSVGEMERRLRKKDHSAGVVGRVIEWLLGRGYLDDREFARQFVSERLRRRPRGRFALVQELRKRGIERGLAENVVDGVLAEEGVDELEIARDAARRWLVRRGGAGPEGEVRRGGDGSTARSEMEEGERRRLYAYLQRRGFDRGTVGRVVDEVIGRS